MGRRLYSRQPNGRFRRATLENTFGISAPVCPECRRFNPHEVGERPPEDCHACGAPLKPCPSCGSESRAELAYVPGATGQPVSCPDDWHDEDAKSPGDHAPRQ